MRINLYEKQVEQPPDGKPDLKNPANRYPLMIGFSDRPLDLFLSVYRPLLPDGFPSARLP
ncbi:MAG: hypothetical protein HPY51_05230 [Candidatus Omnitrophica bacterium]|nr:hypothetical protein [Candidatus Omnitrophota bacterium]